MDIPLEQATAAVVGATGAIGRVCAEFLADDVAELILIGRREDALEDVACQRLQGNARAKFEPALDGRYCPGSVDSDGDQRSP